MGSATTSDRQWLHRRDREADPQRVEVLGWTQHGATVLALEDGWLPMNEPSYVRISELELVDA